MPGYLRDGGFLEAFPFLKALPFRVFPPLIFRIEEFHAH